MKVYTAHYPSCWLGGYAVIVAPNEDKARALVLAEGKYFEGEEPELDEIDLEEVNITTPNIIVLFNGDY